MTLEGTLEAAVSTADRGPGTVTFEFAVSNAGTEPVELRFTDAAKAEFTVEDEGEEVWRFTEGRVFAQVISADRLAPDETTIYSAEWTTPKPGEYTAIAELRAQEATCEARTPVVVPK